MPRKTVSAVAMKSPANQAEPYAFNSKVCRGGDLSRPRALLATVRRADAIARDVVAAGLGDDLRDSGIESICLSDPKFCTAEGEVKRLRSVLEAALSDEARVTIIQFMDAMMHVESYRVDASFILGLAAGQRIDLREAGGAR